MTITKTYLLNELNDHFANKIIAYGMSGVDTLLLHIVQKWARENSLNETDFQITSSGIYSRNITYRNRTIISVAINKSKGEYKDGRYAYRYRSFDIRMPQTSIADRIASIDASIDSLQEKKTTKLNYLIQRAIIIKDTFDLSVQDTLQLVKEIAANTEEVSKALVKLYGEDNETNSTEN